MLSGESIEHFFIIPCIIRNSCQLYISELCELRKGGTSCRVLRCGHCNS